MEGHVPVEIGKGTRQSVGISKASSPAQACAGLLFCMLRYGKRISAARAGAEKSPSHEASVQRPLVVAEPHLLRLVTRGLMKNPLNLHPIRFIGTRV